jgi:hypothetical protein
MLEELRFLVRISCCHFSFDYYYDATRHPRIVRIYLINYEAILSLFYLLTTSLSTSSMAMAMASHPASSSSSSSRWDVFLSFRGEDTRTNFTAHLYEALRRNGISTFMDTKLRSGDEISPALLKAIEESETSIIVLSKNYASSGWCLDELKKILDCRKTRGQRVLPLFYDVTPAEVRHQTKTVKEAFAQLEKWYKDDEKKVNMWKSALTQVANLSGLTLENGYF